MDNISVNDLKNVIAMLERMTGRKGYSVERSSGYCYWNFNHNDQFVFGGKSKRELYMRIHSFAEGIEFAARNKITELYLK